MSNPFLVVDRELATATARSFLSGLPSGLLDELIAVGDRIDVPAGSTVYRQGDYPRAFLVLHGLLRVYMTSPEGRQVTVRYARLGDVLGIAVLVGGPADVAVQALADSGLFRIDRRILTTAGRRDAAVAWALAEELNRRLCEALQQTAVNTFGSVRQRIAGHLLDIASAEQRPNGELIAPVTQQELADAVGSVREVIARVLRDFRRSGLVATGTDRVRVSDPEGLHDECWRVV